jgi:hypothetical protein
MTIEEQFWIWFTRNEDDLFSFERDQERIFGRLFGELQKVNPELTFEFGPKKQSREFVISAGGIRSAFPAVVALAKAAPALPRWQVIAFRPRRSPVNTVEIGNLRIDPEVVQFTLLDNGKTAGIYLYIPGFQETETAFKQIGYLLLDEALGEFDVEERLGLIKMLPIDAEEVGDRHPLADLPPLFDELICSLEGRSLNPS